MRHSPLEQINPLNVATLAVAWTYHTRERETLPKDTDVAAKSAFEATPIIVDGVLYLATPTNRVVALDARTGQEKWVFDPKVDLRLRYSEVTCRGVATWAGPDAKGRRIFVATIDGRLIALDAATGAPCDDFGKAGEVDLKQGVDHVVPGHYQATSPPAVLGDLVIVGSSLADNVTVAAPRGVVRAYDAVSAALRWSFDPIPRRPDEDGFDTWRGDRAHATGGRERLAAHLRRRRPRPGLPFHVLPEPRLFRRLARRRQPPRQLRRLPARHHRRAALVVPDGPPRRLRLRRADAAGAAALVRGPASVDAVAVGTKTGHLFVLDRQTGKPLFANEERPVPQSRRAGRSDVADAAVPRGASDVRPATADRPTTHGVRPKRPARRHASGFEPLRSEGPFTPASLRGSVQAPAPVGGFNWGGLSYDPKRNLLVGATNRVAAVVTLVPRDQPAEKSAAQVRGDRAGMDGTPLPTGPGLPARPQ